METSRTSRTSPRGLDLSQIGRHRAGTPIPRSHPSPTPTAGHLSQSVNQSKLPKPIRHSMQNHPHRQELNLHLFCSYHINDIIISSSTGTPINSTFNITGCLCLAHLNVSSIHSIIGRSHASFFICISLVLTLQFRQIGCHITCSHSPNRHHQLTALCTDSQNFNAHQ